MGLWDAEELVDSVTQDAAPKAQATAATTSAAFSARPNRRRGNRLSAVAAWKAITSPILISWQGTQPLKRFFDQPTQL